ncbi:class I SAM-dependent methyltransferase, partial [Eubacterium sp.]
MNSTLKSSGKNWYKEIWSLDIKNQSWVENTVDEVAFIIKTLKLNGKEKILDMACGFGRHSLEFARRGYEVVGVDITKDYVDDAIKSADHEKLK